MPAIAVIGTSKKENEKRVPVHPRQIEYVPEKIRRGLVFEKGYGAPFGVTDEYIESLTGSPLREREDLLSSEKTILITKPVAEDFMAMSKGATVCGWIHTVQHEDIAQLAIDKRMTLIAWENMYFRSRRDRVHIFYRNNEMAGYCGVQHALQLRGIDGNYGPFRKAAVLSFGSVSRGAVYALRGHGFHDITVYMHRPVYLAGNKIPGIKYKQIVDGHKGSYNAISIIKEKALLIDELTSADIIVNGMLQNPLKPEFFISDDDIAKFKKECLLIDISCDIGMGFSFARPTNFSNPVLRFGNILYYAVDHTPTLLWDSASWVISNAMIPFLKDLAEHKHDKVMEDATDILNGNVLNKDILIYQHRAGEYPYPINKEKA
jgi:N5-(carboxyethyl)ornithine synthase